MMLTDREREVFAAGRADGIRETLATAAIVRDLEPLPLMPAPGEPFTLADLAKRLIGVDPLQLTVLRPFDAREALSVKAAARIAGFVPRTVFLWTERYHIGRLVVGSMRVSHPMLLALLESDPIALAALLSGRRTDPAAAPYLRRAGLMNSDRHHGKCERSGSV